MLNRIFQRKIFHSNKYWDDRYANNGNSGVGSYGKFAEFKAVIINDFVLKYQVQDVIELGCGDGNQLDLANYPKYIGFDVSSNAINLCKNKFVNDETKSFKLINDYADEMAEVSLSLDVIFHLIEDEVYETYMANLFKTAKKYVIIYSSNENLKTKNSHVLHRKFSDWVEKNQVDWNLKEFVKNKYPYNGDYTETSFSDFYIYENILKISE